MEWMPQAIRDGIIVVLIVSGPLVLAAALIGLVIGVLQAATQVQEQTIGSALKIIGVFALIIFAGFWMYQYLSQYASRTLNSAFYFVPKQSQKAVPTDAFDDNKFNITFDEEDIPVPVLPKAEKIEEDLPQVGIPPGVPYVGAPTIPKPPKITKLSPPALPTTTQNKILEPSIESPELKSQELTNLTPAPTPSITPTPTQTPLEVTNITSPADTPLPENVTSETPPPSTDESPSTWLE